MRRTSIVLLLLVAAAPSRPARSCCQLGGSICGDPVGIECNDGVVCFIPYKTCSGARCTVTNEGLTCLATSSQPGRVAGLRVDKDLAVPGNLALDWDASCSPAATDYSVHEGTLGAWYSHESILCSSGGALSASIAPGAGGRYYLVAPVAGDWTGSFGVDSSGAERPDSASPCTVERAIAPCP